MYHQWRVVNAFAIFHLGLTHEFLDLSFLMNKSCVFSYIIKGQNEWMFGCCEDFSDWQNKNPTVTTMDAQSIVVNRAGTTEVQVAFRNPITEKTTFKEQFQRLFAVE
jgi:hypothetical protein